MGHAYECKCNKCGYEFSAELGIGFLFPDVYKKTVKAMKKGKYGSEPMEFFKEYPYGAVNCEYVVLKCSSCKEFFKDLSLDMYISNKDFISSRVIDSESITERNYVALFELEEKYILYKKFDHKCPKCKKSMENVDDFGDKVVEEKIKCPKCNEGTMIITDFYWWD